MADKRENEMTEDNAPTWIRTLTADGEGRKTKSDLFEKVGSKATLKGFRCPRTNSNAVKVGSIYNVSSYYNASFFIVADMFGLSFYGIIGISRIGSGVTPFAKLTSKVTHGQARILFVENGNYLDIYLTGSYASNYVSPISCVFSMSEYVLFDGIGEIVEISSLTVNTSLDIGTDT